MKCRGDFWQGNTSSRWSIYYNSAVKASPLKEQIRDNILWGCAWPWASWGGVEISVEIFQKAPWQQSFGLDYMDIKNVLVTFHKGRAQPCSLCPGLLFPLAEWCLLLQNHYNTGNFTQNP